MGCKTTTALLVLAAASLTNAYFTMVPDGKELVYHYHALVKAGTHLPTSYASAFILDGHLHVQTDKNSTFMFFSDMKYKLMNGEYDEWHEFDTTYLPLGDDLKDLTETFKVVYDTSGKSMGIATGTKEKDYVVNIKRAIGAIMQLDTENIKMDVLKPYAFDTTELTIFGKAKTYYNMLPEKDHLLIQKMHETHSTRHLYARMATNVEPDYCSERYDEPLVHDSQKTYKIEKKEDLRVVTEIQSTGGIYYHPFEGKSDAQHLYMNQTFTLMTMEAIKTKLEVSEEKYHSGLLYKLIDMDKMDVGPFPDLTHRRRTWDMDKLMTTVESMLHGMVTYLREQHINMNEPNVEQGQLVNRINRLMNQFDLTTFKKLHEKLCLKTDEENSHYLDLYYHMLPLIGTHAAFLHMKSLIKEKKVSDRLALNMLHTMPFHVIVPNKKLIEDMEEMINWGPEITFSVRKSAILSFATLIRKGMERYEKFSRKTHLYMPDEELLTSFGDDKYYEKYILEFVKKLKATTDYDTQILYLAALHNTRLESIMHHLMPAVTGEWWEDNYLRTVAAMAISPVVLKHEELAYKVYWPIISNTKLSTGMRISAYYFLMESQPNLSRLINLAFLMTYEQNYSLYQFHYKYITAMSKTTDPCKSLFKTHLKQILRYTEKPVFYGMTGFYQMDFDDTKYGFGKSLDWVFIHSPHDTEKVFKISLGHHANGISATPYTLFMRYEGIEDGIFENLKLQYLNPTGKLFNYSDLLKTLKELRDNKKFKLNMMIAHYDQIVMSYTIDAKNVEDVGKIVDFWTSAKFSTIRKYVNVHYPITTQIFMPTEIGFPATFQMFTPKLYYFDYKITKETANKVVTYHVDSMFKLWLHGREGLSFYNPIVDVWQGVNKYHSLDAVLPMYFDITVNAPLQSIKLSWKRHGDLEKDVIGLRSHVQTMVFVKDDMKHNILTKCSPEAKEFVIVSLGEEHRHNYTLLSKDYSNTGYQYLMTAYDTERFMPEESYSEIYKLLRLKSDKNYNTLGEHMTLTFMDLMSYLYLQPIPVMNGFMIRFEPSKQFVVTNNDLSLRFNSDYKPGEWLLFPASKLKVRATYSIKNLEKPIKTWDVSASMDLNAGHTLRTMKMQIQRLIPGQKDYKICIDSTKEWNDKGVTGNLNIATSQSGEATCKKDENVIEINLVGEMLADQLENKHNFGSCYRRMWSDLHEQQSMSCYAAQSSIRKYMLDIKTIELPSEFKKSFKTMFDWLKNIYTPHYSFDQDLEYKLDENSMKILVEYPMIGKMANVYLHTSEYDHKFIALPTKTWLSHIMYPDNLRYSYLFKMMHNMGLTRTCFIDHDSLYNINDLSVPFHLPTEWTMYLGDKETDSKHGVMVKKIEGTDKIAVKIMHKTHTLEIIPHDDEYEFILDGQKLADNLSYHAEDWFYYNLMKETNVVTMLAHHLGLHFLYDGHHLHIEIPQVNMVYHGHCMDGITTKV